MYCLRDTSKSMYSDFSKAFDRTDNYGTSGKQLGTTVVYPPSKRYNCDA